MYRVFIMLATVMLGEFDVLLEGNVRRRYVFLRQMGMED